MLKVILNRLKPQAEEIVAREQGEFGAGGGTAERIFSLGDLCERCLQHRQNLCGVFIDFREAFDRVRHAALWATMQSCSVIAALVRTTQALGQGCKYGPDEWQHERTVQNSSRSRARISSVTHPPQQFFLNGSCLML